MACVGLDLCFKIGKEVDCRGLGDMVGGHNGIDSFSEMVVLFTCIA